MDALSFTFAEQRKMRTITPRNGHPPVQCYGGAFRPEQAIDLVFEDESLDGMTVEAFANWQQAIDSAAAYAERRGSILIEATIDS